LFRLFLSSFLHASFLRLMMGTLAIASGWSFVPAAQALEYHGYFRSGLGFSKGGSDQTCFKARGSEGINAKHRLGNECETYVEMALSEEYRLGRSLSDPLFKTYLRLAFRTLGHRDWESSEFQTDKTVDSATATPYMTDYYINSQAIFSLREAYIEGTNLWGPSSAKLWAGKRLYRRRDLHMIDYYIFENTGPGVGMEDLEIQPSKGYLHFSMLRNVPYNTGTPRELDGPAQTNLDMRYTYLAGGGHEIEPVLIYGFSGQQGSQTGETRWEPLSGYQAGLVHTWREILGGRNMAAIQYGKGIFGGHAPWLSSVLSQYGGYGSQSIAQGDDASREARMKSSTLRIADELILNPSSLWSLGALVFYQKTDFGGAKQGFANTQVLEVPDKEELTFGLRPVYHFTDIFSLAFEYGSSQVRNAFVEENDLGDNEFKDVTLQKFTLAPQAGMGREYWEYGKPQLRLFYTYALWSDSMKETAPGPYTGDTTGWTAGAQMELWW
jgi:maltoporin